jgi:thioredoxin reductase
VSDVYDVVIAGGGPAGLSAALVLGRARRRVLLADAGKGRNAPAAAVHGYLTQDGTPPEEFRALAQKELHEYRTVELRDAEVTSVTGREGDFAVELPGGRVRARRLLLATGVVDDLPEVDGLADLWGRGVFHCPYCHGYEVRDEPIAVLTVEPGDVSMVAKLAAYSDQVVVCTGGLAELGQEERGMLARLGVGLRTERITGVEAADDRLRRVVFAAGEPLEANALFVHGTTRQASGLAEQLGCQLLEDGSVAVDDMQLTSVPGVYAAGDLARKPSMPLPGSMVSIAVAAGAVAAVGLDQQLLHADLNS